MGYSRHKLIGLIGGLLRIGRRTVVEAFLLIRKYSRILYAIVAPVIKRLNQKYWQPQKAKLVARYVVLQRWYAWDRRPQARRAGAMFLSLLFVGLLFQSTLQAAPDLSDNWDLSNPADYTFDSGIEMTSGVARLKALNYEDDANTRALFHFDESGGATAQDSSANNNDATVSGGTFSASNLNNAVTLDGVDDYVSASNSSSLKLGQQHTIEAWTKFNSSFDEGSRDKRNAVVDKGDYQLYYDNENGRLTYELANSNATTWQQYSGWGTTGPRSVSSSVSVGTNRFVGLGNTAGTAEVWTWNGSAWTMIGGDGINGSWADQTFEEVLSLETDGTNVYAGLGLTAGDAEVWMWNGSTWEKIGGDAINGSWQVNTFEAVYSLSFMSGNLYAGLGNTANDAEVWRWNGASWTKIGGDSLLGGWTTNFEFVYSLANDGTNVYAGLGNSAGDAEVWMWNGATWSRIGGDGVNSSWNTVYETVRSLTFRNGVLYAGVGDGTNEAEVWQYSAGTWSRIGGAGVAGSWNTNYEGVYSLVHNGTDLFAGIGTGNGEGEVWRLSSGTWTQVGGDGLNGSWASAFGDVVPTMHISGSSVFAGVYDTTGSGFFYEWNGSSWAAIGGQNINKSWGNYNVAGVEFMQTAGDYLYAGLGVTAGNATVWRTDGQGTWEIVGGQGVNGSWAANTYEYISSMTSHQGNLYVGLASTTGDAEVWMWNGANWTMIGGDNINSGWNAAYEEVNALASNGGLVYAGLGNGNGDAEVWSWNGSVWSKIGGDNLLGGWNANYNRVSSMAVFDGRLIAGLGTGTGEAEVWSWNGTGWTQIGGDTIGSSWGAAIDQIETMVPHDNKLYVGLGNTTDEAQVWEYNGTGWTQVGGSEINDSWIGGTYERVRTLASYNGDLYAGLGNGAGDGEVWRLSEGTWVKVAGNNVNGSWGSAIEEVRSFGTFKGKLYSGTGSTANADANVWTWGDNGYLQSSVDSFDDSWRHVAATYDGTTMKLFINGALDSSLAKNLSVGQGDRDLLIGSGYGGREQGKSISRFEGQIDEVRLSGVARTEFNSTPYTDEPQTIAINSDYRTSGVWHWDTWDDTANLNGGTITYRLSADSGTSWLYWNGSSWTESSSLTESNTKVDVTANFESFPVTFDGLRWQAILDGDGNQRVELDAVDAEATSDTIDPSENPSNIQAFKTNGGDQFNAGDWTNGGSPFFEWDAGDDDESGVLGYCAYLGTDNSADPISTKGILGNSPVDTGGNCQFVVDSNQLDLSLTGYLGSPLTTSNDDYYLKLRTIDSAGNVTTTSEEFNFKFDNTPPNNPGFISAPSGFINTKDVTLTWPTSGAGSPSDDNSGLSGLQYRIGPSGTWYGDAHSGTGDSSDLLANDGSYTTLDPTDYDDLIEGINTVYFRAWDSAGNVTSSYVTAALKINTNGAPSEPNNLTATPATNTVNSFGFEWDAPGTFVGDVDNISYCYTVNILPSASSCVFTGAGSTELTVGAYATQPGANQLYVVARDESSNINYLNYATVTFTANTSSPGILVNTDIVDVSIKSTSNWRLALTWEEPSSVGTGVTSYRIFRSDNGVSFAQIGSSTSTTYIDANLSKQPYYYRVSACDNTNNCGAQGSIVSETPTGKFTTPAVITSQPTSSGITTRKATINWATDRNSDSKIAIGTKSGVYSPSEVGSSQQVTDHTIKLDNLSPGTTYYYVAKWTDEDGNTGTSSERSFTTSPAPSVKEIEATNISLSSATINFTSTGAVRAAVYYGTSDAFGGVKAINTSTQTSSYSVQLDGLADGSKYYYMISTFDEEGDEYRGNTLTFNTPPRPRIENLRFQPVSGEPTSTQKVTWDTNVPSTSQITYGKIGGDDNEIQDSQLVTSHEITIRNLEDDSEYRLVAQSRDADGNVASSEQQVFRTELDTRPPKVSDMVVEASIRGTGSEARGQIVVSWRTDEPAASQVAFSEGSGATSFNNRTAEDTRLTTEHLVIISDLPTSRVYSVAPISKDASGNEGQGEVETAIIGRASDNVITIVFNTLRDIFGF
jgi:hypothetical protein